MSKVGKGKLKLAMLCWFGGDLVAVVREINSAFVVRYVAKGNKENKGRQL